MAKLTKYEKAVIAWNYFVGEEKRAISELKRKGDTLNQAAKIKIDNREKFIEAGEALKEHYDSEIKRLLGRVPPQATDLEEAILGALLLEKNVLDQVKGFLMHEHFYDERHAIIYKQIQEMDKSNIPIDMRSIVNELRKSGNIELAGGAYYIAELTSKVSSAANIVYHTRSMIEYAIKRELIKYGAEVINDSYDDTKDVFRNLDKAEEMLIEIKKINVRQ